jgi:heme a synthase
MEPRLTWTRRLGVTCLAVTFVLMVVGAWVKATGSGLACPDWPSCYDTWVPPFPSSENGGQWDLDGDGRLDPIPYTQAQVLYEWTHRALAVLVGVPVLAFALVAGRGRAFRPALRRLAWAALGLLVVQGALGALTVRVGNSPWATTLHLATAVVFLLTLAVATCLAFLAPALPAAPITARPASPHPAFAPGASAGFVFQGEAPARPPGEGGHGR